jgi:hypothetical protein
MNGKSLSSKGETIFKRERWEEHWKSQKRDRTNESIKKQKGNRKKYKIIFSSNPGSPGMGRS